MLKVGVEPLRGDFEGLYSLAKRIWLEHYTKYYEVEEVKKLCDFFTHPKVVARDVDEGYRYFFLTANGERAGYIAFRKEDERVHLGKFYVAGEFRGKGIGRYGMKCAEEFAKKNKAKSIFLTCGSKNDAALKVYERLGFRVAEAIMKKNFGDVEAGEFILEKSVE